MTSEEKEELIGNIELSYIKFARPLVEYCIPRSQKMIDTLNDLLVKHIRPAIDNFKKEIENGK